MTSLIVFEVLFQADKDKKYCHGSTRKNTEKNF